MFLFYIFFERPLLVGIAIALAIMLIFVLGDYNPRLGEILGMDIIFDMVVIGILAMLAAAIAIGKIFLPRAVKKRKNRARALRARNSKD